MSAGVAVSPEYYSDRGAYEFDTFLTLFKKSGG
jgi:hypothetical protein